MVGMDILSHGSFDSYLTNATLFIPKQSLKKLEEKRDGNDGGNLPLHHL
jgi:hypothetical protein